MNTADILDLFEYAYQANQQLLAKAAELTPEQFVQGSAFPHGGVRDTFVHILFADWIWRSRLQGNSPKAGDPMPSPGDYPDLASLRSALYEDERQMRAYLAGLQDADLGSKFTYTTSKGIPYQQVVGQILVHVIIHGTQHRAELAQMLTELGHSPGDIDYLDYLRKK